MNDKGEITRFTEDEYDQLSKHKREALIALSEEQAAILGKLPQEDRAAIYPLMSRRERRAQERAAKKGK